MDWQIVLNISKNIILCCLNNLLTIIQLNNYYKPMTNPSKILKLKAKDIDYMIISNPKIKINLLKIEVDIPIEFFKNFSTLYFVTP